MYIELGIFLELPSAEEGARQTPLEHAVYEAQLVQFNPPHSGLCSWFSLTPLTVASAAGSV